MRLQVNVNDKMLEKIDKYCGMMAVSRSALCGMLIGQGLMGFDKSFMLVEDIGNKVSDGLLTAKFAEQLASEIKDEEQQ